MPNRNKYCIKRRLFITVFLCFTLVASSVPAFCLGEGDVQEFNSTVIESNSAHLNTVDSDKIALKVQLNGVTKAEFTRAELLSIAKAEGEEAEFSVPKDDNGCIIYSFSVWNTYPSFEIVQAKGPSVGAVLREARDKDSDRTFYSFVEADNLVKFSDGAYVESLTGYQLLGEDRYYYPNGEQAIPGTEAAPDSASEGKVQVPAVIDLSYSENSKYSSRLCFGQVSPNEENNPAWVKYIAGSEISSMPGIINVTTTKAPKCEAIKSLSSDHVAANAEIGIADIKDSCASSSTYKNDAYYDKIYYSFDGTEPDYGSAVYNNAPQHYGVTKPTIAIEGLYTMKTIVKGYGKLDSDVSSFDLYICNGEVKYKKTWGENTNGSDIYYCGSCGYYKSSPHSGYANLYVSGLKLSSGSGYFKASWKKPSSAKLKKITAYQIRYSTSSKFTGAKWITVKKTATSYKKTKLKKKKKYYVQMRNYYKNKSGKYFYSKATTYKYVTTKK